MQERASMIMAFDLLFDRVEVPTEKRAKRWAISIEDLVTDQTGNYFFFIYLSVNLPSTHSSLQLHFIQLWGKEKKKTKISIWIIWIFKVYKSWPTIYVRSTVTKTSGFGWLLINWEVGRHQRSSIASRRFTSQYFFFLILFSFDVFSWPKNVKFLFHLG
jgi:hypothetical protein